MREIFRTNMLLILLLRTFLPTMVKEPEKSMKKFSWQGKNCTWRLQNVVTKFYCSLLRLQKTLSGGLFMNYYSTIWISDGRKFKIRAPGLGAPDSKWVSYLQRVMWGGWRWQLFVDPLEGPTRSGPTCLAEISRRFLTWLWKRKSKKVRETQMTRHKLSYWSE